MIKNVCLVDTPYALSIYLLKMSMDEIQHTLFFVGDSVNKKITEALPHYVLIRNQSARDDWKYMSRMRWFKYLKCFTYPFAKLYVQDHLYVASQFIGPYHYINLPDGPDYYTSWEGSPFQPYKYHPTTVKRWIKHILSHGPMYDLKCGMNEQCISRWITTESEKNTIYLKGKEYEYIDAARLWENANSEKRDFVMQVFGVSYDFINNSSTLDTLILSQPLREDCSLTDDEMVAVYKPVVDKYPNIAVKTHPRDKFDWKKFFPNVMVIDTYAPMQLLNYMGFNPKKAITVCSSSLSAMPDTTEKIFLGTKVNEKIFTIYGDLYNK